jgi:hypothetical protein
MSQRSRQTAALLIILLLIAFSAWGCGGSEEETATTAAPVDTTVTSVAPVGGTEALIGTQLRTTPETPVEYVDAVKAGQPVVIMFYVPAGVDDQKVLESLTMLQGSFPDYAFLIYDFADPDAYGDLSTLLQVDYPPAVIMIDDTGTIETVWNGYVDEGTLNQDLVDLGV